jgi:hypothetical protein
MGRPRFKVHYQMVRVRVWVDALNGERKRIMLILEAGPKWGGTDPHKESLAEATTSRTWWCKPTTIAVRRQQQDGDLSFSSTTLGWTLDPHTTHP